MNLWTYILTLRCFWSFDLVMFWINWHCYVLDEWTLICFRSHYNAMFLISGQCDVLFYPWKLMCLIHRQPDSLNLCTVWCFGSQNTGHVFRNEWLIFYPKLYWRYLYQEDLHAITILWSCIQQIKNDCYKIRLHGMIQAKHCMTEEFINRHQ